MCKGSTLIVWYSVVLLFAALAVQPSVPTEADRGAPRQGQYYTASSSYHRFSGRSINTSVDVPILQAIGTFCFCLYRECDAASRLRNPAGRLLLTL